VNNEFEDFYEETDLTKDVRVAFGIKSDKADPNQITGIIGIAPTTSFKKGEIYSGKEYDRKAQKWVKVKRKRGVGIWRLELRGEHPSFGEVEKVINQLLSLLEPKRDLLKPFLERRDLYTISVFIWVETNNRFSHILLDNNLLFRLSELCHLIQFTTEASSEYIESVRNKEEEKVFPTLKRVIG